jgi:hypothetical protein
VSTDEREENSARAAPRRRNEILCTFAPYVALEGCTHIFMFIAVRLQQR